MAGEGGRSGGGRGRRQRWGAGSWLLQFWRCCLLEQAVEGTQEDRAPSLGARPPPGPPPRRRTASPSGPGLAQRGQCAPTCPWLGTKTGPGKHLDGDGWKRLHGEWGLGLPLPSYQQQPLVASRGAGGARPVGVWGVASLLEALFRTWVLPTRRTVPCCLSSSALPSLSPPVSQVWTVEKPPSLGEVG